MHILLESITVGFVLDAKTESNTCRGDRFCRLCPQESLETTMVSRLFSCPKEVFLLYALNAVNICLHSVGALIHHLFGDMTISILRKAAAVCPSLPCTAFLIQRVDPGSAHRRVLVSRPSPHKGTLRKKML